MKRAVEQSGDQDLSKTIPEQIAANLFDFEEGSALGSEQPQYHGADAVDDIDSQKSNLDVNGYSDYGFVELNTDPRTVRRRSALEKLRHTPSSRNEDRIIRRRPSQRRSVRDIDNVFAYERRILERAVSLDFSFGNSTNSRRWAKTRQRRLYTLALQSAVKLVRVDFSKSGDLSLGHLDPETKRNILQLWRRVHKISYIREHPDFVRFQEIVMIIKSESEELSTINMITLPSRDAYLNLLGTKLLDPGKKLFWPLSVNHRGITQELVGRISPKSITEKLQLNDSLPEHDQVLVQISKLISAIRDMEAGLSWYQILLGTDSRENATRILTNSGWEKEIARTSDQDLNLPQVVIFAVFSPVKLLHIESSSLLSGIISGQGGALRELYKKGILTLRIVTKGVQQLSELSIQQAMLQVAKQKTDAV